MAEETCLFPSPFTCSSFEDIGWFESEAFDGVSGTAGYQVFLI